MRPGVLSALVLLAVACSRDSTTGPSAEPARSMAGVSYGASPQQSMDIELPAGRGSTTAVVVFIHGGAWWSGDKGIFTAADVAKFTSRGFATVNMNYRLANAAAGIVHPMLSDDITAVMDFIAAHAAAYKVSPSSFALVGHSAGGHLALLAAYRYNPSRRIKAVASLAGPADLTDPALLGLAFARVVLENYLGATQAAQPALWTGASPTQVATASAAPTIQIQGRLDPLVPYTLAEKLHAKLMTLGVADEYRLYPLFEHDLGYAAAGHFPDVVWDPVVAWFERWR